MDEKCKEKLQKQAKKFFEEYYESDGNGDADDKYVVKIVFNFRYINVIDAGKTVKRVFKDGLSRLASQHLLPLSKAQKNGKAKFDSYAQHVPNVLAEYYSRQNEPFDLQIFTQALFRL